MARPVSTQKVARPAGSGKPRRKPSRPRPAKPGIPQPSALVYHPGPPIASDESLAAALAVLRSRDTALVDRLLAEAGTPPLRRRPAGLPGLAWIVVSQQVSTASANAIYARAAAAFPDFLAADLAAAEDAAFKACGLSAPKIRTLRAIAEAILAGSLDFTALESMEAAQAHRTLLAIKGIGPWTADIFLLFCLGHPDAWPAGDLALQEAARMALRLRKRPDAKRLETIAERWRPVRGVAARLLWAWYGAVRRNNRTPLETGA
jgi:DNA-3-methyladenine glycosylase II